MMKYILTLLIASLISLSAYAGSTGSTEMGPFVDCKLPNGQMDYMPSMVCKMSGGVKK